MKTGIPSGIVTDMMKRLKRIKIKIKDNLLNRVKEAASQLGISRNRFVLEALEHELKKLEIENLREVITLEEINQQILSGEQAFDVPIDGDLNSFPLRIVHCELCRNEIKSEKNLVQGPHFCKECLELAKGGDFSQLEV